LSSPREERTELLCRLIRQRAWGWPHRFGKVGQDVGINRIRLGKLAGLSGKLSHLPRIHHGDRNPGYRERTGQRRLQTACGLEHYAGWASSAQLLHESGDLLLGMRNHCPFTRGGAPLYPAGLWTHQSQHTAASFHFHTHLLVIRPPMPLGLAHDAGFNGPGNRKSSREEGRDDPC
jgi:hypothetical protein